MEHLCDFLHLQSALVCLVTLANCYLELTNDGDCHWYWLVAIIPRNFYCHWCGLVDFTTSAVEIDVIQIWLVMSAAATPLCGRVRKNRWEPVRPGTRTGPVPTPNRTYKFARMVNRPLASMVNRPVFLFTGTDRLAVLLTLLCGWRPAGSSRRLLPSQPWLSSPHLSSRRPDAPGWLFQSSRGPGRSKADELGWWRRSH
jgi:hypothetical protein